MKNGGRRKGSGRKPQPDTKKKPFKCVLSQELLRFLTSRQNKSVTVELALRLHPDFNDWRSKDMIDISHPAVFDVHGYVCLSRKSNNLLEIDKVVETDEEQTDEGEREVTEISIENRVMQPTYHSVDEEVLRKALDVCELAVENTLECLVNHDTTLGRTTDKNKLIADRYESEISAAKECRNILRLAIGWNPVDAIKCNPTR